MGNPLFSAARISGSGMSAERQRMELVANNIANAHSTRSADGGPYRRQSLVFQAAMDQLGSLHTENMSGVKVLGVAQDDSEFPSVYMPGHPDQDEFGMVRMPNVKLPNEMVDLITASRSYEANLRALTLFREMVEETLSLLRRGRS